MLPHKKTFQHLLILKYSGFLLILFSLLPLLVTNTILNIIAIFCILIGIILLQLYRCPRCKTQMNPFVRLKGTYCCKKCGYRFHLK